MLLATKKKYIQSMLHTMIMLSIMLSVFVTENTLAITVKPAVPDLMPFAKPPMQQQSSMEISDKRIAEQKQPSMGISQQRISPKPSIPSPRKPIAPKPAARKAAPAKKKAAPKQKSFQEILESDPEFMGMDQKQRDDIMGELGKISNEDWKKINSMAQEMQSAIDKMGGEDALKNMSEKELDDFITSFADNWDAKYTEKEEQKEEKKPKKELKKESKEKAEVIAIADKETLLASINAIIKNINLFLGKAANIHELSEKIETWAKEKTLTEWGIDPHWNAVKHHIELFQSKLIVITNVTGKKRYFDYIYENEALRKKLMELNAILAKNDPLLSVRSFGLEQYGKEAQDATLNILKGLGDAIHVFKINDAINKAIEKHEPLAKEMRDAEDKLLKAAEQEAKKKPIIGRASATPTGALPMGGGYAQPTSSRDADYYPGSYGSYGHGYHPSYDGAPERRRLGDDKTSRTPKDATSRTSDKEKEEREKEKKKELDPALASKINSLFNTITDEIEEATDLSSSNAITTKLAETHKIAPGTPLSDKVKKTVKEITEHLDTATKAADDLYSYVGDPKPYEKPLTDSLNTMNPTLDSMRATYKLDALDKAVEEAQAAMATPERMLSNAKQKHEDVTAKIQEITEEVAALRAAGNVKEADETEKLLNAAQEEEKVAKEKLQEADDAWATANTKRTQAADKRDAAVPGEVMELMDTHRKLQRKIKRFAKKSTSPALITGTSTVPTPKPATSPTSTPSSAHSSAGVTAPMAPAAPAAVPAIAVE